MSKPNRKLKIQVVVSRPCCARPLHAKHGSAVVLVRLEPALKSCAKGSATCTQFALWRWLSSMRYYSPPCVEHSPQLLAILCACSALLLSAPSITAASVRGVPPELVLKYDTNADVFRCLDGSKSLLTSRVNDDYCDCLDGSDEPGRHQRR